MGGWAQGGMPYSCEIQSCEIKHRNVVVNEVCSEYIAMFSHMSALQNENNEAQVHNLASVQTMQYALHSNRIR